MQAIYQLGYNRSSAASEARLQRPRSMTVIGVIGLLWGSATALMGLIATYGLIVMPDWFAEFLRERVSPEYWRALQDDGFRRWGIWRTGTTTLFSLLLVVGAVRLLRLEPRGWQLMMAYVVLVFLWAAGELVADFRVYSHYRQVYNLRPTDRPGFRLMPGLIYPAIAAYFLTRPKVAEAYQQYWFTRDD